MSKLGRQEESRALEDPVHSESGTFTRPRSASPSISNFQFQSRFSSFRGAFQLALGTEPLPPSSLLGTVPPGNSSGLPASPYGSIVPQMPAKGFPGFAFLPLASGLCTIQPTAWSMFSELNNHRRVTEIQIWLTS